MTGAEISVIEKVASSQYVWAILFLILAIGTAKFLQAHLKSLKSESERREQALIALYEQQRADSRNREEALMAHLDKTTKSLEAIEKNLSNLEQKMNSGLSDIWNHLEDTRATAGKGR